jgi:pimeloyl-ACP methyl ester carboxylesterase
MIVRLALVLASLLALAPSAPQFKIADIGNGIHLHYAEQGRGTPVIFVHGSLSDYGYWKDEFPVFSPHYRVISYSRRYNFPNDNLARAGYSAIADADDLAAFVKALHLGKVDVVGHSYGAYAAMFFAIRHPEMVRALVLAEPPAVSLLRTLPGKRHAAGIADYNDIQKRMVAPMKRAFRRGDTQAGVADFIDYVFNDPRAWTKFSPAAKRATLRDAREWDVMMTSGTLFPQVTPQMVRGISAPVLLMTGTKTYPFLSLIMERLAQLLPHSQTLAVPGAGHQMWYQDPRLCQATVENFLARH